MKIGIGSDHGGYRLKEIIKEHLHKAGYDVIDYGTDSEASVDYPDFGHKVAHGVADGDVAYGIVMCGTGIGISLSANKVPGIRCALCNDAFTVGLSRQHNDANMLAMGGRVVGDELAKRIVDIFLSTDFEGGRHERRVNKIEAVEK